MFKNIIISIALILVLLGIQINRSHQSGSIESETVHANDYSFLNKRVYEFEQRKEKAKRPKPVKNAKSKPGPSKTTNATDIYRYRYKFNSWG